MKSRYAILAKRIITDGPTNVCSVFDIVEEFQVQLDGNEPEDKIMAIQGDVSFGVLIEAEAGDTLGKHPAKFYVDTPRGRFLDHTLEIDFQGLPRSRVEVKMNVMPYAGEGTYTYNLECQGQIFTWEVLCKTTAPLAKAVPVEKPN